MARSEFDLIASIRSRRPDLGRGITTGIGDDCAILSVRTGYEIAITTDTLVQEIDFRETWMPPHFLGLKALAVSLSDLAAMGAEPHSCLVALALPTRLTGDYFNQLADGLLGGCARWQVPLVGGDLSENDKVVVTVTALGEIPAGRALYRREARTNDRIVVIGQLGLARCGLSILERENPPLAGLVSSQKELDDWAGTEDRRRALRAHLLPEPLLKPGRWIREKQLANTMIDVSDGLTADLMHILTESQVAAELEGVALDQLGSHAVPVGVVLDGGEDYALLITLSEEQLAALEGDYPSDFPPYFVIGRVVSGIPGIHEVRDGVRRPCLPKGFEHFQ